MGVIKDVNINKDGTIGKAIISIDNNTKHFGTKMPNNGNLENENDEKSLSYTQMIMGSMASLVWGVKGKDKETDIRNLLGKGNSLFNLVESIKDTLEPVKGPLGKVIIDGLNLILQNDSKKIDIMDQLGKVISDINTNIDGLNLILQNDSKKIDIMDQLLITSGELHKTAQNLVDASKSTKEYFEGPDFKKHFENKLTIEFANNPKDLNDITNLISELNKFDVQNNDKLISSLNGINKLISTFSKNEIKVNGANLKKNIKIISNVLLSNKDGLETIVTALSKITKDKKFDDNIHYIMGSLNEFFAIIVKLGEIDKKKIRNLERNINYIKDYITISLVEIIKEITESLKDVKEEFSDSIYALNELFERLFDIADFSFKDMILLDFKLTYLADIIERDIVGNKNDKDSTSILIALLGINGTTLNSVINKSKKLSDLFEVLGDLINNDKFTLKNVVSFLIKLKLIDLSSDLINENVGLIESVITQLNNITPDVTTIKNTLEIIEELLALKGNVFGARSLKKSLKIINASVDLINEICENIKKNIKDEDIKRAKEVIGTFTNLLFNAAGILLIAGLVMRFINPVKLILFAVTLGAFMWAISKVFSSMAKNIEKDIKISKDAIELVAISGAILILGGIAMNLIAPAKLMLFALTLGVFMLLIATSYLIFNKVSNETFKSAKDFGILIAISAGVLMLGAVFMMNPILGLAALGFGILLTGFITLISFAYAWASKDLKSSLNSAKGLAILVGISGITLMIGALFMQNGKLAMGAIGFALILGGFIMLVMLAIKIGGKNLKSALPTMIGISILVAVAAMTLLIGGGLFALFPNLVGNVILFGIVLLGFITVIGLICAALNKFKKYIEPGIAILGGIILIVGKAAIAIGLVALVSLLVNAVGYDNIWKTLGIMGGALIGMAVICGIIGIPEIEACVGLGIIVVGAMTVLLYLMIGTIAALVAVVKYASTLPDWETLGNTFLKIGAAVYGLVALTPAFLALSAASILMAPGIAATIAISIALAGVAKTIQMWADLRIPEYDSNGKVIGYKPMDGTDLDNAALNIESVLETLFEAIKNVYDKNKSIFNVDWNTLLTGKNPIQRVISSSMKMGKMLANIAYGIKAWAKLTIPEYGPDGKIVGYKTIDNSAFRDAAENIKEVITCLGQAIIDVYSSAPEGMFVSDEWFGLGNTPFGKVTKALKTMGPMLSSIADGVKDWAELKIPIYKNGKIINYHILTSGDFLKAQGHIIAVVQCLANAILEMYEKNHDMFDDDSWHGFGDSPFSRVVKSLKTMGGALENIADAAQSWADLKIPIYGDRKDATKITGYKTIDDKVFKKVAKNISYVVTALATSIAKLANHSEYGKLFRNGNWFNGGSSVAKVLKSIKPLGSALKDIADAIVAWSSMKVPEYGDPKNPTKISGYKQLSMQDITDAHANISSVIQGLIGGIANVYNMKDKNGFEYKTLFDSTGALFWKSDSPVVKVLNTINPIGKALKNIADALKAWAELKIPIYGKTGIDPIGYMSIGGDAGIETATDNIQKVLKAMIKAVASVYYGKIIDANGKPHEYQELFKNDGKSIINTISSNMSKVAGLISNAAKGISDIVELKIPVYDKNGKIIKYNNIEEGNFDKVGTVINNVLTSIGQALVNVATNPKLNPKDNPAFGTAVEAIKFSTDILSGIADVVANYATGKFVVYKVQKGKLVPEKVIDINNKDIQANIHSNIITVLTTIGDALALMIGAGSTNKLKYATDKNNMQITRTQNIIVNLMNSIAKVFTTIGASNKSYINNKKALENLIQPSTDPKYKFAFVEDINKTLDLIVKINSELVNHELFLSYLDTLKENQERLTTGINSTYTVITTFLGKLTKLANINRKVGGTQFNNISDIIGKFVTELGNINKEIYKSERLSNSTKIEIKELINDATDIVTLLDNFTKILQTSKSLGTQTFTDLTTGINSIYLTISNIGHENNLYFKAFTSLIENYISTINTISDAIDFDEKLSVLEDGILGIYKASISTSNKGTFAAHVETLKKYIATVNSIQLDKINAMTDFVNAMNQLSNKLGNLDNLTNAIANRLTVVLNELVSQLMKADKSINNAHELQEKRKRLINESLGKIENIMGQHMIVEISQVETDETGKPKTTTSPTPTEDGSSDKSSTITAPDAEDVKPGKLLSNPEDETTKKGQTAVPFKIDTSNLLTIDIFKNFMENLNLNRYSD